MTKARDIADFKFENITDTGTEGTKVASGTTAQRGSTTGQFRFNSTTGKFEGRNTNGFVTLEVTPTVSSVNSSNITQAQIDANFDLVITGANFSSGDTVKFVGNDNTEYTSPTVTINSSTQITARITSNIDATKEPYKVQITSVGGLTGSLASAFNIDASPVWQTASGSLGDVLDSTRGSVSLSATATDDESDTITYSVQSGSLPSGLSLNSSTGAITGSTSAVGSDTTSNFTLRATSGTNTTDRAFSITLKAPISEVFSYTGSNQTFTVPTGVTSVVAHVFGAGGGGGTAGGWQMGSAGGGGGAATGTINVSSLSSLLILVGQGGGANDDDNSTAVRSAFGGGAGSGVGSDQQYGGGGGGLSGIFNGSYTHGNSILIAGGGAGGGSMMNSSDANLSRGGAGGGTTGQNGTSPAGSYGGGGGTQSAGGTPTTGGNTNGNAGSALQGGVAADTNYGGGGGGGYYGGAGGTYKEPSDMGGGGGGSGYQNTSLVSSGTLYQGNYATPGNSSSSYRSGAGDGGAGAGHAVATDGDNGRVVIVY
jgi:hypothetical protein